jgi:outer membrane biosynthesis protein TonB
MNGLQKRCVVLSSALHGILIVLFFIGSGFIQQREPVETVEMLTFIPDRLIDGDAQGGGSPEAPRDAKVVETPLPPVIPPPQPQTLQPQPKQPQPEPPQPVLPVPEPKKDPTPPKPKIADPPPKAEVKEKKEPKVEEPKAPEPERDPKLPAERPLPKPTPKRKVDVNLTPAVRSNTKQKEELARAQAQAEAEAEASRVRAQQAAAAAQKQRIMGAISGLQGKLSKGGVSAVPFGPGGETYANYDQYVVSLYDRAWRVSDDISDSAATVKAKIVIARDGKIISAQIVPPRSTNVAFDKSVQSALNRIESIGRSFPDGVKEEQRTIYINFNLQAKRASG